MQGVNSLIAEDCECVEIEHIPLLKQLSTPSSLSDQLLTCTTGTLVSVTETTKQETYHVLMLAPGHIESIMGYQNAVANYSWEISTIHTKKPTGYSVLFKSCLDQITKSGKSTANIPIVVKNHCVWDRRFC